MSFSGRPFIVTLFGAVGLAAASVAAQPPGRAGGRLQRVVQRFDFEERRLGNFEAMPMHWYRLHQPGFPRYTKIGFDTEHATSAKHALKLKLNGGSAAVRLEPGAVSAVPGARYRVAARYRTKRAVHSRARLVARFLGPSGKPIVGTRRRSALGRSNGTWSRLRIELPPAPENAAWIVMRLQLLQPRQYQRQKLGAHELVDQDLKAAVWFDDVTVYQMPQIELTPVDPLNFIRRPDRPALRAKVRDLTGQKLRAELRVVDHTGALVAERDQPLGSQHPRQWDWRPELERLGWYLAELRVLSRDGPVGRSVTAFCWARRRPRIVRRQMGRFLLLAHHAPALPAERRKLIAPLLERIGPQSVMLGIWHAGMDQRALRNAFDRPNPLIDALLGQRRTVMLSLPEVPAPLAKAAGTDPDRPLDLIGRDPEYWRSPLRRALARYGNRVRHWQLGTAEKPEGPGRKDLAKLVGRFGSLAKRFVGEPRFVLPWSATRELTEAAVSTDGQMMAIPSAVRPGHIRDYAESWPKRINPTYRLQPLPAGAYSNEDRAADLARRMIESWRTGPRRLAIASPWRTAAKPSPAVLPGPMLGVWVHMAEQLAGRTYSGRMDLGSGVKCYIFSGRAGGALAVWNRSNTDPARWAAVNLGGDPVAHDVWGNRTALETKNGKHLIPLRRSPRIITGLNLRLAKLRAGFRLEPGFAPSTHAEHEQTLTIPNPFQRSISGRVRITGPDGWNIRPRLTSFTIPAGQSMRVPLTLSFPISELAGRKRMTARMELDADRQYELNLEAPLRIGLKDVELSATLSRAPNDSGPADVVITLSVTNRSEQERSFYAFALPPGMARRQRIVAGLGAGQTMLKRFRLSGKAEELSGRTIRVGLRQTDGPAVLNKAVEVP